MKIKLIEDFKQSYEQKNFSKCDTNLFLLVLSYNTDILEGHSYDHDLKHILFKRNCIRNPISMKYTSVDYDFTKRILLNLLNTINKVNNPQADTLNFMRQGVSIDAKLIQDILDIVVYTDCFYKMNSINSTRMDECIASNIPFKEQLYCLLLFYQDQTRLFKQNYQDYLNKDYITGMELAVAKKPVEYYDNLESSVSDSFETNLESMNQIVHYLYYKHGNSLAEQIHASDLMIDYIRPYENVEFERYLYIASQRYLLCRIEEGIRYGYYKHVNVGKNENQFQRYAFSYENEEKSKARSFGLYRREYQIRSHAMLPSNQEALSIANVALPILANELISTQDADFLLFDFSDFHPDIKLFQQAENISVPKESIVKSLTKEYYLECKVKGVTIRDLLCAYKFLETLSEILFSASTKIVSTDKQNTYIKELCLIDTSYLFTELSRIHSFDIDYSEKLIMRFVFHETQNRDDDLFAQPLVKISKTQIVLCHALLDQVNLDRFIERQFIRYKKNVSEVGHIFEKKFIEILTKGYREGYFDLKPKTIPNFSLNTNKIEFDAFDGRQIEFDLVAVLGDFLILTELKAVMTSYDISDLETRKQNVKDAIKQLQRRAESVKYDWKKIRELCSIELPSLPYDQNHIILIACTDAYDFTPLKYENVFITDDSTYLKYFTNPYIDAISFEPNNATRQNIRKIWGKGYPDANEFMEYLMNPTTTQIYSKFIQKKWIPIPVMDEKDCAIFCEEYQLTEDPIRATFLNKRQDDTAPFIRTTKKIYPNDPCPCGSGKKYKHCCKNKEK